MRTFAAFVVALVGLLAGFNALSDNGVAPINEKVITTMKSFMASKKVFAERFAAEWIEAWNSHDLSQILSHYAEDFEMTSPVILEFAGEPSGTLKGKKAVGAYWSKALERFPNLRFELVATLVSIDSITLYYKRTLYDKGPSDMVAEVLFFGPDGKVVRAAAHYSL